MNSAHGRRRPAITSRRHPLVTGVRKLARRPSLGEKSGRFLLDGIHLLEEALDATYEPEAILAGERLARIEAGARLLARMDERGWPVHEVPEDLLADAAPTVTPQGVLGLFLRPPARPLPDLASPGESPSPGLAALVLAGIQDPQNLGALARAARVFGCRRLIAVEGTVDFFHPRALRASAGTLLRLELFEKVEPGDLGRWIAAQGVIAVALAPRGGERLDALRPSARPHALVLGAEGGGIAQEVERLCQRRWTIPMAEGVDSLGVAAAGAIALYAWAAVPDASR